MKGVGRLREAAGSRQPGDEPRIPEWGNPAGVIPRHPERMALGKGTGGTETSQYLEEQKATAIPLVAASERGAAQTRCA
jgi:hypothetical protein